MSITGLNSRRYPSSPSHLGIVTGMMNPSKNPDIIDKRAVPHKNNLCVSVYVCNDKDER